MRGSPIRPRSTWTSPPSDSMDSSRRTSSRSTVLDSLTWGLSSGWDWKEVLASDEQEVELQHHGHHPASRPGLRFFRNVQRLRQLQPVHVGLLQQETRRSASSFFQTGSNDLGNRLLLQCPFRQRHLPPLPKTGRLWQRRRWDNYEPDRVRQH